MALSPLQLFLLVGLGIMVLFVFAVVFLMGTYASPTGKRPPMTMPFVDLSPLAHGGDMRIVHVKYHPKTMHYIEPLRDNPMSHGLGRVVLKEGLYGMRQRDVTWETKRIQLPKNIKNGYGTYCADLLHLETQERLDRLEHENSDLRLKLHESDNTARLLSRNVNDEVERQVEQRVKELQKMLPMTAPRRTSSGGSR